MSEDYTPEAEAPAQEPVVESPQEPEAQAPEQPPEEPPAEDKKPDRVAKRFSELSGQRDAAKAEAEYWRQQALTRQADPEPSFEDEPAYSDDALAAAVQRALATERQNAARQEAQNAQAEKAKTLTAKLYESGLEGAVLIASGADIPFTQAMIDALSVSEQAGQVAHHLGTNPTEAARIAALPPQLQGYELAKLEGRLASQPRTTNALPPTPTVGARANPVSGLRDDMPIEDWVRLERERVRARGR